MKKLSLILFVVFATMAFAACTGKGGSVETTDSTAVDTTVKVKVDTVKVDSPVVNK